MRSISGHPCEKTLHQLQSEDIAAAILYAVTQPPYVNVNEILIRPIEQAR
jgi:NADP-dependent 3-hydroxy acid dehydrogenase YdfG